MVKDRQVQLSCSIEDLQSEGYKPSIEMTNESKNNSSILTGSSIRLSALSVTTFSGEYNEWSTFHDIFTFLIHNNTDLSLVEKFFYLRFAVTGDVQNCIRCVETT